MAANFNDDQINAAKNADLYEFLICHHSDEFKREGGLWLRYKVDDNVSIGKGRNSYMNFSTGEHGGPIQFLTDYLGYNTVDAVLALSGSSAAGRAAYTIPAEAPREIVIPDAEEGSYKRVFAYLTQKRGISVYTVQRLVDSKILFQEKKYGNAVFINRERNWGEWRGTNTFAEVNGQKYRGTLSGSRSDGFWWFRTGKGDGDIVPIYICESAIDAISLYEIHRKGHEEAEEKYPGFNETYKPSDAYYIGIGGTEKLAAIDRIIKSFESKGGCFYICVDNDVAGEACRQKVKEKYGYLNKPDRMPRLIEMIPADKDWNEVLVKGTKPIKLREDPNIEKLFNRPISN